MISYRIFNQNHQIKVKNNANQCRQPKNMSKQGVGGGTTSSGAQI